MDYVKLVQPGFETFTGDFGQVVFKDGVSVEPLTQRHVDRLAACLKIAITDEDGEEIQGGVAARLVGGATIRAEVASTLARQTEEEKVIEGILRPKLANASTPTKRYTLEELEAIASKDGIAGLRPIGKDWNVKARAIPDLIEAILTSQNEFGSAVGGERLVTEQTRNEESAPVIPGIEKLVTETVVLVDRDGAPLVVEVPVKED